MALPSLDLWTLVRKRPQIDPGDLAEALRAEAISGPPDYRSRLLIRDSLEALKSIWGKARFETWLEAYPEGQKLAAVAREDFDEVGYPSLRARLMNKTEPEEIRQYLFELGKSLHKEVKIKVAGAIALILSGYISRHTEDVDIVDEVPPEIRDNHGLLEELQKSYGLHVGHVQNHYFPTGWEERCTALDLFGPLKVYLLDVYDVFLSKLFSQRRKDVEDLRVIAPQLDRDTLTRRFLETTEPLRTDAKLLQRATDNWRLLFGEDLPP